MSRDDRPSYKFGPFHLDPSEHTLLCGDAPVPLTPKVFEVLRVLVQNAGHLVEKERLLKEVWPDSFVEEGALNRSVSLLRKALGERPDGRDYIRTVPTRGYRFVAPVEECRHDRYPSRVELPRRSAPRRITGIAGTLLVVGVLAYAVLAPSARLNPAPAAPASVHKQVTFTGKVGRPSLSSDGKRIAYVSDDLPGKQLTVQELDGGQPLAIFSAPEIGHLRWSPDGSELIMWARGSGLNGVYAIPQLGGTPRLLARGQYMACWSPDGSTIAVADFFVGKIRFLDRNGREQRGVALEGVPWSIWDIDWSAASGRLAFVSSDQQGRYTIWTIRPDGSDQVQVRSDDAEIPSVRWAPRGDALYYFRRLNQTVSLDKILVQPADRNHEGETTTLISGLETDGSLALSADGERLVYARAPFHSNLWMLDLGGHGHESEAKPLTHGTSLVERPEISPDGTSVVFNMGHDGLSNLYTMPITGGPPKQLTFLHSWSLGGVWSPDGERIAFASTEGGRPRVWTVPAGGGIPHALSASDVSETFDLAWSPATRILYQQAGNRNYQEIDPGTGEARPLVRDASSGWVFSPATSPDGGKIAVSWNRPPNRGVWVIETRGRHERMVYPSTALSTTPIGWSADGHAIYVVEGKPSTFRGRAETMTNARIVRVALNGGPVKTVAALDFDDIGTVSMTPDGRRFVFSVYSTPSDAWVVDHFDAARGPRIVRAQ